MLKLTGTKYDKGNSRLYCTDHKGFNWVIVNINTCNNPIYQPHSHTSTGEPDSPIIEGVEWVLIKSIPNQTEFYEGMSNKTHSFDDFRKFCSDKHSATGEDESMYSETLKSVDKIKFQLNFKQAHDLNKRCEKMRQDI